MGFGQVRWLLYIKGVCVGGGGGAVNNASSYLMPTTLPCYKDEMSIA